MFDYIIVGGGSAGCALAARLSENPAVNVALLEAGLVDKSVLIHCPAGLALLAKSGDANWLFETVPQPGLNGRKGYQPRGKVLSGTRWARMAGVSTMCCPTSNAPNTMNAALTPFMAPAAR